MQNVFPLSKSNEKFLEYLTSDFCQKILSSNKLKTHLESDNIYFDNVNTNESI